MQKSHKIWLGIFSAMVIVPELLWSSVGNLIYEFSQSSSNTVPFRVNFLTDSDNITFLSVVLFIQSLGLLCSAVTLLKGNRNIVVWTASLSLFFLFIITVVLFYLSITFGRHGIGI